MKWTTVGSHGQDVDFKPLATGRDVCFFNKLPVYSDRFKHFSVGLSGDSLQQKAYRTDPLVARHILSCANVGRRAVPGEMVF